MLASPTSSAKLRGNCFTPEAFNTVRSRDYQPMERPIFIIWRLVSL